MPKPGIEKEEVKKDVIIPIPPEVEKDLNQEKKQGLNEFSKTLTDLYGQTKIDDLLDQGWILDSKGNAFKKEDDPWKRIEKVYDALNKEEGVQLQHVSKDGVSEQSLKLSKQDAVIKRTPAEQVFIDPKVKEAAIRELKEVHDMIYKMKIKNPQFKNLRDKCAETWYKLTETNNKEECQKIIDDYAEDASQYYQKHAPASLNKKEVGRTSIAYKICGIRDAVAKNQEAESNFDRLKEMQTRIAAKYVAASSAAIIKKYEKTKDDKEREALEDAYKKAQGIQSDSRKFEAAVQHRMADPVFQYCYGPREFESDKEMFKRLEDGIGTRASKVMKKVEKERKNPTKERLAAKAFMKQKSPLRSSAIKGYSNMSPEAQAPIADVVASVKSSLSKIRAGVGNSDKFKAFSDNLDIANIRLQNQNGFMDVRAQIAKLGDAADAYYEKSVDSTHYNLGNTRLIAAARIKDLADQVAAGKEIVPKSDEEIKKSIIADRAVRHAAKSMMDSKDPKLQVAGKKILLNKELFQQQKEKVLASERFQKLTQSPEKIEKAFDKAADKIFKSIGDSTAKSLKEIEPKKGGPDPKKEQQMVV